MPDADLVLTLQSFTTDQLAIKVKNKGGALDQGLKMEITLPKVLLVQAIRQAADQASGKTPPIANLDGVVKGAEGKLSVWGQPEASDHFVDIMFFNDLDKDGAEIPAAVLPAGAEFTILIPLDPAVQHVSINLPYGYEYNGKRVDRTLELKVEVSDLTPEVTFTTTPTTRTALTPGTDVTIEWTIKNGVSADLYGPLPGGSTKWALSDKPDSKYKLMSKDSFVIKAVSSMTFMLIAEVKGPSGKPNVQVGRMLSLDIHTDEKYGYIAVRPSRVLPYGLVEFDWAAWGVNSVRISTASSFREIELTDKTLSGFAQGSGVMRITAPKVPGGDTKGRLYVEIERTMREAGKPAEYTVAPWKKMEEKPIFTGTPAGLAIAVSKMGLLTSDGLWIANVGEFDESDGINDLNFTKATLPERPKAWLAIAALNNKFVVLRQSEQNDVQVALYKSDGTRDEIPPVTLPDVQFLIGSGTVFDLAVFGNRAYVVVETGRVRVAFSVAFNFSTKKANYRNEVLLEALQGYRLLTFDDALFALHRDSGQMLRFEFQNGKLEPYKAASAVDGNASMIKKGVLVPVGRVLAVLSPTTVPSLAALSGVGLKNVLPYKKNLLTAPQDTSKIPQDLVYNPQTNRWSRCGHGLELKECVVAFRGGGSQRLWAIDPNGDAYTLTGATEDLFLPDYYKGVASKRLPAVFNKTREFSFINNTGMDFEPLNEICSMAGLEAFSADRLVQLMSPLPTGPTNPKSAEPIALRYNDTEGATITLRFLAKRWRVVWHDYVLEVTLSGPHFSYASICYKRLTVNEQRRVVVTELPGKLEFPIALGLIETFPRQLGHGITWRIRNLTPYTLWLRSPEQEKPADRETKYPEQGIKIRYDTPPFSIYAHGVGELPVDVDFTLPDGIEMSSSKEVQTQRIRIRQDDPKVFAMEAVRIANDTYECTLRYKVERELNAAFLGDGVPSKDGASIYLPIVEPPNISTAKILKLDANNLQTTAQVAVAAKNIFTCPNSVVPLANIVVANFDREHFSTFDHSLKPQSGPHLRLFEFDVITNLKGPAGNTIFLLGMKRQPTWQVKNSYKWDRWSLSPVGHEANCVMDFFNGYGPRRVPEAPPWVAPNTISPMDVRIGAAVVICVEGGIIGHDLTKDFSDIAVALPGTGREEAILVDPTEHVVFCAHSKAGASGLMISRINLARPSEKLTVELPGPVMHVVTDPSPPTGPNLEYYRPRAVSLLAASDRLFVSHGRKLFVLDKTNLTQRQIIELNLPTRLIHVRRGKPPGENHAKYGSPQECYFVWAIGSRYAGNGEVVNADQYRKSYEIELFKIAILP